MLLSGCCSVSDIVPGDVIMRIFSDSGFVAP